MSRNERSSRAILTYPSDLSNLVPSFLQIAVKSFDVYSKERWVDPDKFEFTGTIGKIINLPIPVGLIDSTEASWNNELTASLKQAIANKFLEGGTIRNTVASTTGNFAAKQIVHEFSGISAKGWNFSWMFLPQNKQEASVVEEIGYELRRAALHSMVKNDLQTQVMKYPNMLEMKIIGPAGRYQKFLPSFINSVSIDRNFDDSFIEYEDSGFTPSVQISLQTVEISNYTKEILDRVYGR